MIERVSVGEEKQKNKNIKIELCEVVVLKSEGDEEQRW